MRNQEVCCVVDGAKGFLSFDHPLEMDHTSRLEDMEMGKHERECPD